MDCKIKVRTQYNGNIYEADYSQSDCKYEKYFINGSQVLKAYIPTIVFEIFNKQIEEAELQSRKD